jgi:hypothetical protein
VFAYLCADDAYLPWAVRTAVAHLAAHPECAGVYGEGQMMDEQGRPLGRYPTRAFDAELLRSACIICQPAAFLRRDVFAEVGMLDPGLHYALDYDLWIRVARRHRLLKVDEVLASSRMHRGAKTFRQRRKVYQEHMAVAQRHYGYAPVSSVYGYCCALLDHRDGFFEPVPPSLAKCLLTGLIGSWKNWRHLPRFWAEIWRVVAEARRRKA